MRFFKQKWVIGVLIVAAAALVYFVVLPKFKKAKTATADGNPNGATPAPAPPANANTTVPATLRGSVITLN